MKIELDLMFGEALLPLKIDPLESEVRPRSLQRLDAETAILLRQLIQTTENGLGVARYVYCELPILWIVSHDGGIWFAIEEIIHVDTREFLVPRLRNANVGKANQRLGHPSLINGGPGRIGGEILFDINARTPAWFITNGSGRYGLRKGRHAEHLSNASKAFAKYGIILLEYFIPTRREGST